jgi:hypothetical protein
MVKPPTTAFDWSPVFPQALAAAQKALGQKWGLVSTGTTNQIKNIENTAIYIAKHKDKMTAAERKRIIADQNTALENVILLSKDIDIAIAEETTQAVWTVIGSALQSAAGIAIKAK